MNQNKTQGKGCLPLEEVFGFAGVGFEDRKEAPAVTLELDGTRRIKLVGNEDPRPDFLCQQGRESLEHILKVLSGQGRVHSVHR